MRIIDWNSDVCSSDLEFELLAPTTNNTWGLGFSEEFDVFLSTANNEHSDHYAIPNRLYDLADLDERGIEKIDGHYGMHVVTKNLRQVDVHGGFTAAAGHNLYRSEERRVGKACVSTCRYRWSPMNTKKKTTYTTVIAHRQQD